MLTVGQKLWWVPRHKAGRHGSEVSVVKVARVWAYLSNNYRCDRETLVVDGGGYSAPADLYLSKALFDGKVERESALRKLRGALDEWPRTIADDVTVADIEAAGRLLRLRVYGAPRVAFLMAHQQRVVEERAELQARITKLQTFFGTAIYSCLDSAEQDRLQRQVGAMQDYSDILGERIAAFAGSNHGI